MHLIKGDLWQELDKADYIFVTANSTVTKDGRLVMGCGAAKECRDRYPGIDLEFGRLISHPIGPDYRWMLSMEWARIGILQVKRNWLDRADLELVRASITDLADFCGEGYHVALNFPGIGAGGLARADVLPILEALPNNFYVYERP